VRVDHARSARCAEEIAPLASVRRAAAPRDIMLSVIERWSSASMEGVPLDPCRRCRRYPQRTDMPPSTMISVPVTKRAASEAR
jgi:hypothetical protein